MDTIIIISDNMTESIPHVVGLNNFIIFINNINPNFNFEFVTPYIILEQDDVNMNEIIIRAAILLTSSNNIIICKANNIPTSEQIIDCQKKLYSEGSIVQNDNYIGVTKSYLIVNGFEKLYNIYNQTFTLQNSPEELYKIAQTINGEPSSPEYIIKAIKELVGLDDVMEMLDDESSFNINFWEILSTNITSFNPNNPKIIIWENEILNVFVLKTLIKQIPTDGAVIFIEQTKDTNLPEPFHKLLLDTGEQVLIFTKNTEFVN